MSDIYWPTKHHDDRILKQPHVVVSCTKNPKTRKITQLMDKWKGNVTLCCVLGYAGITGNEEADEESRRALKESIPIDEKYPQEDLSGWIRTEMAGSRQRKWEKGENAKKNTGWKNDSEKLKKRDQVAVSKLKNGCSRARFAAQNSH
jgi:hypothetical protein